MNKSFGWLAVVVIVNFLSLPAFAQSYPVNPWQDTVTAPSARTGKGAVKSPWNVYGAPRFAVAPAYTAGQADQSVNNAPIPSAQFNLGFGAAGPQTGRYGSALPPVATSSVSLSITDGLGGGSQGGGGYGGGGGGGGGGGDPTANLPPPPGPGYQPIFQHGVFVGYMSPDTIALMQTDPTAAWTSFAQSSDFVGPEGLRLSLLAETGAATPEQMAQLEQMALFGM